METCARSEISQANSSSFMSNIETQIVDAATEDCELWTTIVEILNRGMEDHWESKTPRHTDSSYSFSLFKPGFELCEVCRGGEVTQIMLLIDRGGLDL